jgi:hypothetical protein
MSRNASLPPACLALSQGGAVEGKGKPALVKRKKVLDLRHLFSTESSKPRSKRSPLWVRRMAGKALLRCGIGKAVAHLQGNWAGLSRFLDDPYIPLDNNLAYAASGMPSLSSNSGELSSVRSLRRSQRMKWGEHGERQRHHSLPTSQWRDFRASLI